MNFLNPALAPIKAKILMFAAGAVLVLLAGSIATSGFLWRGLGAAKTQIGRLESAVKETVRISNSNAAEWEIQRESYVAAIDGLKSLRKLDQDEVRAARARQRQNSRALEIALDTLKETGDANSDAAAWMVVPIPDAVIDGMCVVSARATDRTEDCDSREAASGGDPGTPFDPVPNHPTS